VRIGKLQSVAVDDAASEAEADREGRLSRILRDPNIVAALRTRARKIAASYRWNSRILVLAYAVLAVSIVVAIESNNSEMVALIALPGLAVIWIYGVLQGRKADKQAPQDVVRDYADLIGLEKLSSNEHKQFDDQPAEAPCLLSVREMEVLNSIASGRSNKETAVQLSISEQTVKNHLKHVYTKIDVNDRTAAVLTAIRHGWIKGNA
jgi:DNA-binding CsgD family transcriptional regulator